jgi:hypothetical protein
MARSSITTLVDFLRHLHRLLLVDNLGACLQVGCVSNMWGVRGRGFARGYETWWNFIFEGLGI